jgi:hypothetical protein
MMERGVDSSSVIFRELRAHHSRGMAHQRNQPSMGDSLKTPHSVSLKVLRYVLSLCNDRSYISHVSNCLEQHQVALTGTWSFFTKATAATRVYTSSTRPTMLLMH